MKLHSISVSRYRSITSAKKIRLDRTTVLIGPNNEGKSNILRSLVIAMNLLTRGITRVHTASGRSKIYYRVHDYNWNMDFPINLQGRYPNGETEIILEFALEPSEYSEFKTEVGSNITGLLPLRIGIGQQAVTVTYHKKGKGSNGLSKKSPVIAEFVSKRFEFEHIPAVRTAESAQETVSELVGRELRTLESDENYQEALNLIEKIQQPLLRNLAESIQETLMQFLPEVKKVEIELPQAERIRAFRRGVSISVDDGALTPLNYKGDGVQSLAALAMIRYASEKSSQGKNFVIAIEEPESHLHPKAIHQLKKVIDDLSIKHQIMLTSHNPLFVDRRNLSNNIIVNNRKAKPAMGVEEIREILGVRASDNLRNAEMVLVVEGDDDIKSLKSIIRHESPYLKTCIDNGSLAFDSLSGGTNLPYKLSLLRDAICLYHVFLDDDHCGRESYKKAKQAGLLTDDQINLAKANGRTESEFEDLVNLSIYEYAIQNSYTINLKNPKFRGKKKWSERISDVFSAHGKPWDDSIKNSIKRIVSNEVFNDPSNAINAHDKGIIDGLIFALEHRLREKCSSAQTT